MSKPSLFRSPSTNTEILRKTKSGNPDAMDLNRENVGQYVLTSLSLELDHMCLPSTEVCKLCWTVVCGGG